MFGVSKEKLLQGLKGAQQRNCCYIGPTCDCKYGIRRVSDDRKIKEFHKHDMSEQTGCPELRQALAIIREIPEEKFNELCLKAKVSII